MCCTYVTDGKSVCVCGVCVCGVCGVWCVCVWVWCVCVWISLNRTRTESSSPVQFATLPIPLNYFICGVQHCTWCVFVANCPTPCYQKPYATKPTQPAVTHFFFYSVHIDNCSWHIDNCSWPTPLILTRSVFCTGVRLALDQACCRNLESHGFFHIEGPRSPINTLIGLRGPGKWRDCNACNAAKPGISLTKQYGVTSHVT